ncbi:serine carboxypeptidase-like 51 [Oryza brachyantha]|uniref:serine carboxypeptidase-like 51 n=1 Tax=Oryza brachyantha TaxID=4533 RepID=UPI001ADBECB4|nr:serine carboxypeptidase-like 51 [Oryza brachyantha]
MRGMEMQSHACLLLLLLVIVLIILSPLHSQSAATITNGTADGSERWGYVQVRPKTHLFWWYYKSPQRVSSPANPWPTILWLEGGPGASGIGQGNFVEGVGPLDANLNPRNSTWLSMADLIFVDFPVGVGYSYAEDPSMMVTSDLEAVSDAMALLEALVQEIPTLPGGSPLFLVGESYGGKFAAMIGVAVTRAIRAGTINLTLGGATMRSCNSTQQFANPEHNTSLMSYPWLLTAVSRLDDINFGKAIQIAHMLKQQTDAEQFTAALKTFIDIFDLISSSSGYVSIYNFMTDNSMDPFAPSGFAPRFLPSGKNNSLLVSSSNSSSTIIDDIMNGVIKQKLKIIPKDLVWQDASLAVFESLSNDFMRPAIEQVDELLSLGVNVTVYNGQLDLICSTIGAEAWVRKLKWSGLHDFLMVPRKPIHNCKPGYLTNGFVRSYKNLHFYWVLGAGHYVAVDQPCTAKYIIGIITRSPASGT